MLAVERRESARKLSNLKQSRLEENIWRESQQGTEVDGRAKCQRNGVESRGIRYHVASHFRKQPASALEQKEGFLRENARMFDMVLQVCTYASYGTCYVFSDARHPRVSYYVMAERTKLQLR